MSAMSAPVAAETEVTEAKSDDRGCLGKCYASAVTLQDGDAAKFSG